MTWRDAVLILACYAVGCITTGYYLVRWRTGEDIRNLGSGSTGARNVGRAIGPLGFLTTFFVDVSKGVAAIAAPYYFHRPLPTVLLAMTAVVAGHIWPIQLRFRGGKGVAPAIGAIVIFDPKLAFSLLIIFGLFVGITKRFTLSGLAAVGLAPVAAWGLGHSPSAALGLSALVVLLLIAHRDNIHELAVAPPPAPKGIAP